MNTSTAGLDLTLSDVKALALGALHSGRMPNWPRPMLVAHLNQTHHAPKTLINDALSALVREGKAKRDGKFYKAVKVSTQERTSDPTAQQDAPEPALTLKPLRLVKPSYAFYLGTPYRKAYIRHICGVTSLRKSIGELETINRKQAQRIADLERELRNVTENNDAVLLRATLDRVNKRLLQRGYTGNLESKVDQVLHAAGRTEQLERDLSRERAYNNQRAWVRAAKAAEA